jgi:hypothetical protein
LGPPKRQQKEEVLPPPSKAVQRPIRMGMVSNQKQACDVRTNRQPTEESGITGPEQD